MSGECGPDADHVLRSRNWDAIAARQKKKLQALLTRPGDKDLLALDPPEKDKAGDPAAARSYAAQFVLKALEFGFAAGFKKGLRNDARLFAEVAASPSGQEWIRRFLEKDPLQAAYLKLVSF